MKNVSPSRAAAFDVLLRVEREQAYAPELLHSSRLDELSPADRGLATEITMGVLRWRSKLDAAIRQFSFTPFHKLDLEVLTALRIGAYQLLMLERIPARAAVNESVEIVKQSRKASAAPMANAVLRKINASAGSASATDRIAASVPNVDQLPASVAKLLAHPEWLVDRWAREYGIATALAICEWDQRVPPTSIRLRGDADAIERELHDEGIELAPGRLMTSARTVLSGDVTHSTAHREGRIFIQDEGSQLVAVLVGHGERILDCCAAPGGKTLAMADNNPQAQIVAAELHPHRARLMQKLVRAANVEVVTADATALPFAGEFDRVLTDVPCSGTGTLARNPEIKWRLKPEDFHDLHVRQVKILCAALDRVPPFGRLVYSSCSLESEENADVVTEALASRSGFGVVDVTSELERLKREHQLAIDDFASLTRDGFLRTIPGLHACDGFFAAVIERRA